MQNLTGRDIDRYHIVERLGEGGMATVYKAYDNRLERYVAIKVIRTDMFAPIVLEEVLKRFDREAKALAKLAHPHIVKIHDYGDFEGMPYLIMEFLAGGTLKRLTGKPSSYIDSARMLAPVARALEYAHQQNVLHRDIKPANILITQGGQPMLTDFGIAKILEAGESTGLTASGVGIGTPEYMAPEQGVGGTVDTRADIYALGVVFYELVTGRRPFSADTPMAVLVKHITEPLPRARQFVPELPEEVEAVIFKALAKQPEQRYADMGAFASALEQLAFGSPPVSRQPAVESPAQAPETKASQSVTPSAQATTISTPTPSEVTLEGHSSIPGFTPGSDKNHTLVQTTTNQASASIQAPKIKFPFFWVGFGALVIIASIMVGGVILPRLRAAATPQAVSATSEAALPEPTQAPVSAAAQPSPTKAPLPTATPNEAVDSGAAQAEQPDCASQETYCVGLVTDIGSVEDASFNQGTWSGVSAAAEKYGVHASFFEPQSTEDYQKHIDKFAAMHYDLIVTVGFRMNDATVSAARKYPAINFVGVDQSYNAVLPNLVGLVFSEDQAGFLVGALAGLLTNSGKVGAVLGPDTVPPVWRYGEGFRAGVAHTNPNAEVFTIYNNEGDLSTVFIDPEWGAETANQLIDLGVDIIFGAGGDTGNGALIAAAQRGVYVIGVDIDQYYTLPEVRQSLLTSAVKELGPSTLEIIRLAREGNFPAGEKFGSAGMAPYHETEDLVPTDVRAIMERIVIQLKEGNLATGVPPTKP